MASKRRIFIAINLPDSVKNRLSDFQKEWESAVGQKGLDGRRILRWTKKESLHITLTFFGYADDEETYEVCRLTRELASQKEPFSIVFEKIIYGPIGKTPRMIWLKSRPSNEASELKKALEKELENSEKILSFQAERRDFSPHITLARMKENWRLFDELPPLDKNFKAAVLVTGIDVMESDLKDDGAEYIILESCPLG